MRIAITGQPASGKTSLAYKLCQLCSLQPYPANRVRRIGFHDAAQDMERRLFGESSIGTDDTDETTIADDAPSPHADRSRERHRVHQLFTKMREVDPDVWVNLVCREIDAHPGLSWVVDDLQHPNELEALRKAGFFVVRLYVAETVRCARMRQERGVCSVVREEPDVSAASSQLSRSWSLSREQVLGPEACDMHVAYNCEEEAHTELQELYRVLKERWGVDWSVIV